LIQNQVLQAFVRQHVSNAERHPGVDPQEPPIAELDFDASFSRN
jgi:hypothetical protein